MTFTQADLDSATAAGEAKARTESEAALATAASNFTAAQAALTKLEKERQTERIDGQIKDLKAKGIILPADEAGLAQFMAAQEDEAGEFSFSKAEGGVAATTRAQWFADFMASRKPVIKLGGTKGEDQGDAVDGNDAHSLAQSAQSFMKDQAGKGITVSLPEAVAHAARQARA